MTKHYKAKQARELPAGRTGLPLVAIVGRPNVGKSTLFNRLARQRLAIVHDEPGVTRDRHYADTTAFGTNYTLVDTGGFDPESDDPMKAGIARHVRDAIREADVIVFVTDGQAELAAADRAAVDLLRRSDKPVIYAANKADAPSKDAEAWGLFALGVKEVFPVSALHGRGVGELEAAVVKAIDAGAEHRAPPSDDDEKLCRIAIVGKPNAGKSSLLNRLLGEDRMLVDDRPGTTRDSIDTLVDHGGKRWVFMDTAGIRRKGKVKRAEDAIESMSVLSAIRSIERSHVVVLVCDAKEGVAEQDAKILGLGQDRARCLIVALNKSDLLSATEMRKAEERARDKLTFAPYAPIVHISAKTGRGIQELYRTIERAYAAFFRRVGTGELNRFFAEVLETRPPPTQGGKAPRLYYVTQAQVAPPTFVVMSNAPEAIHFSYQRYVQNQLRARFDFEACPVRVHYRQKRSARADAAAEARPKKPALSRRRDRDR